MNTEQKNTITIKLHPCVHRWKKVGICKECKVKRMLWRCQKCGKSYFGTIPPGSRPIKTEIVS